MGRRPIGTGPRRPGAIGGGGGGSEGSLGFLVSYGSDEEEDGTEVKENKKEEELPPLMEGWSEVYDEMTTTTYYWHAATQQSIWERPIGPAKMDVDTEQEKTSTDDDNGEKAMKAALEAEDFFKSLESEMQGDQSLNGGGGGTGEASDDAASPPTAPIASSLTPTPSTKSKVTERIPSEVSSLAKMMKLMMESIEVTPFTESELAKLGGNKDEKLKALLTDCLVDVRERSRVMKRSGHRWRVEAIKLSARMEDWRNGLFPSSSLVKRFRELDAALLEEPEDDDDDEEEEGEKEQVEMQVEEEQQQQQQQQQEQQEEEEEEEGGEKQEAEQEKEEDDEEEEEEQLDEEEKEEEEEEQHERKRPKMESSVEVSSPVSSSPIGEQAATSSSSSSSSSSSPKASNDQKEEGEGNARSSPSPSPSPSLTSEEKGKTKKARSLPTLVTTAVAAAAAPTLSSSPSTSTMSEWTAVWDDTHQAYYYFNPTTNMTTWESPAGIETPTAPTASAKQVDPVIDLDISKPWPVNKSNSLLLFNGEHPIVKTAKEVITLFSGCGARQVREIGCGYFIISWRNSRGPSRAIQVNNSGDRHALAKALTSWVGGARGTFIRYVMDQDEPQKLGKVAIVVREDGTTEPDIEEVYQSNNSSITITAEPVITKSSVQVDVVAKAPALRKDRVRQKKK